MVQPEPSNTTGRLNLLLPKVSFTLTDPLSNIDIFWVFTLLQSTQYLQNEETYD